MFDHFMGLLLLGLGLQSPMTQPMVKGDQTEQTQSSGSSRSGKHSGESEQESAQVTESGSSGGSEHSSGASGAGGESTSAVGMPEPLETEKIRPTREQKRESKPKTDARKSMRDALKLQLKEGRDVYIARFTEHKKEFEEEIETKHSEAELATESKKTEFAKKLKTFKDSTKKAKVEDLQTKISALNTKIIKNGTEKLGKISSILDETVTKKDKTNTTGKDTAAFIAAVTAAQKSILSAQDALSAQAAKTYVVSVTTETNVKNDVGSLLKTLNSDRKTLTDALSAARKATSAAIRELALLRGEAVPEAVIK